MTKAKDPPPPLGRYSYDLCIAEIRAMTNRLGYDDKAVHDDALVQIEQTKYSKKMAGVGSHFTVEEFGRIADFFSREARRPLQGWPFVSNDACLDNERRATSPLDFRPRVRRMPRKRGA